MAQMFIVVVDTNEKISINELREMFFKEFYEMDLIIKEVKD